MNIRNQAFLSIVAALMVMSGSAAVAEISNEQLSLLREHVNRGNLLLQRKLFQQAIDEYQKCFQTDPHNAVAKQNIGLAYNNWGILYFNQRRFAEAKAQWETALKFSPGQRDARNNLVILKQTMQRLGIQLDQPLVEASEAGDAMGANAEPSVPEPRTPASSSGKKVLSAGVGATPSDQGIDMGVANSGTARPASPDSSSDAAVSDKKIGGDEFTGSSAIDIGTNAMPVQAGAANSTPLAPGAAIDSYLTPRTKLPNVPTDQVMTYPDQNLPVQTYENKATGTSVTIISKPAIVASPSPEPPPVVQPTVVIPPQPEATLPSTSVAPAGTVDEQLTAIEMKVFGRKQKNLPVLKRLEKLETGTSGTVGQGNIQERLDALRRAYGP